MKFQFTLIVNWTDCYVGHDNNYCVEWSGNKNKQAPSLRLDQE